MGEYSPATAVSAEGERVGFVTCHICGATILLSMVTPALILHDAWHARNVESPQPNVDHRKEST